MSLLPTVIHSKRIFLFSVLNGSIFRYFQGRGLSKFKKLTFLLFACLRDFYVIFYNVIMLFVRGWWVIDGLDECRCWSFFPFGIVQLELMWVKEGMEERYWWALNLKETSWIGDVLKLCQWFISNFLTNLIFQLHSCGFSMLSKVLGSWNWCFRSFKISS